MSKEADWKYTVARAVIYFLAIYMIFGAFRTLWNLSVSESKSRSEDGIVTNQYGEIEKDKNIIRKINLFGDIVKVVFYTIIYIGIFGRLTLGLGLIFFQKWARIICIAMACVLLYFNALGKYVVLYSGMYPIPLAAPIRDIFLYLLIVLFFLWHPTVYLFGNKWRV